MAKKLWMHVKSLIPKPTAPDSINDWLSNAYAASGLILLNIDDSQHTHVADMEEDPAKIWTTLESIHIQKRPNSRFTALSNLLSIRKQSEESLPSVTTRVEQSLKNIKALCPKDYTLDQLYDDLSCMAMIRSLPSDYSAFVSSITLMDTIDMAKLKTAFITEESNREDMEEKAELAAAANSATTFSGSNSLICSWCERAGHSEDSCFSKKSSLEHDRAKAKANSSRKRSYKPNNSANTANKSENSSANISEVAVNASVFLSDATSCLTPSTEWCVDSGASSHMTPHRDWFVHYTPHVVPIKVADGNIIYSAGIESVHFKPVLRGSEAPGRLVVFSRVLHVPALSRPLLSITSLTMHSGWRVTLWKDCKSFYKDGNLVCSAKM